MDIREITIDDFDGLMRLYTHLHDHDVPNSYPDVDDRVKKLWERIVNDPDYHIIVAETDGNLISSCTCVIIPNLTRGQRSYAFVENVVTHEDYRNRGFASSCLARAKEIAETEDCYKMMLLTGLQTDSTLRFYENAGYNQNDKTAFIQLL